MDEFAPVAAVTPTPSQLAEWIGTYEELVAMIVEELNSMFSSSYTSSYIIGSCSRDTSLIPFNDLDVMILFPEMGKELRSEALKETAGKAEYRTQKPASMGVTNRKQRTEARSRRIKAEYRISGRDERPDRGPQAAPRSTGQGPWKSTKPQTRKSW